MSPPVWIRKFKPFTPPSCCRCRCVQGTSHIPKAFAFHRFPSAPPILPIPRNRDIKSAVHTEPRMIRRRNGFRSCSEKPSRRRDFIISQSAADVNICSRQFPCFSGKFTHFHPCLPFSLQGLLKSSEPMDFLRLPPPTVYLRYAYRFASY